MYGRRQRFNDKMPARPNWHEGERYDICLGDALYYDQGGYHTRVPVWIRDKKTGEIVKRVGEGKQIGNFHPIWVNWNGKKIQVEKMLEIPMPTGCGCRRG